MRSRFPVAADLRVCFLRVTTNGHVFHSLR